MRLSIEKVVFVCPGNEVYRIYRGIHSEDMTDHRKTDLAGAMAAHLRMREATHGIRSGTPRRSYAGLLPPYKPAPGRSLPASLSQPGLPPAVCLET